MKVRQGFVSNSSSSSFIVKLPKKIEEYTLEEFRQLFYYSDKHDPVAVLYDDLRNTEDSHRVFDKWEQEYYGVEQLDDTQYVVQYGNECDGNYYLQNLMECYFMPDLEVYSKDIDIVTINGH